MNVHLIYSGEINNGRREELLDILQKEDGPIKFFGELLKVSFVETDIDIDEFNRTKFSVMKMNECKMEIIPKTTNLIWRHEYPLEIKSVSWKSIFDRCNDFRSSNNIDENDLVFLLTDYANDLNWFSAADPSGKFNYFVNTGQWEYFLPSDSKYPIAFEIMTHIMRHKMFDNYDHGIQNMHRTSRGCINDFCENKKEVIYKMRTGDLCPECHRIVYDKNIDPALLSQFFHVIDNLRSQMLFRERFKLTRMPSKLEVKGRERKLFLTDMGNIEIKLAPLEKTIYLLFLEHEEGLYLNELHDHEKWISETYNDIGNPKTLAELKNSVSLLINPIENSVSEKISRIKNKIINTVGHELALHYIISGQRNERKKISIDRKLVHYN